MKIWQVSDMRESLSGDCEGQDNSDCEFYFVANTMSTPMLLILEGPP